MNIKNILFTSLLVSGLAFSSHAQSVDNGLFFSQETNGGTARFKGMGNVRTSLGGDISSVTGNPAGLGFYSQSDMSVTLNYHNAHNKGSYFGNSVTRNKGKFGIDHAGIVFNFPKNEGYYGWQNFNVGISYENTNRFTNNVRYEGMNPENTIVSAYTDDIFRFNDGEFALSLSDMKLIERFQEQGKGYFPITQEFGDKDQISDVLTTGNSIKTSIAFGGNYNNVFYIGGNIGLSSFEHENSIQFSEYGRTKDADAISADNPNSTFIDPAHENSDFLVADYAMLDDYFQRSEGTGIDFKIGAIYKPTVDWNIGATITSPTWYTIDQFTESYIGVDYYDTPQEENSFYSAETTATGDISYRLITPWKFGLGLTKFFGRGLLSADAEYVNYGSIKVRGIGPGNNASDHAAWDEDFKAVYQGAVNLRVGGEYLLTNILSGRAGFNYFGNPYKIADNKQYSGSLGLGVKLSNTLYMDVAVVHLVNDYKVSPYTLDEIWLSNSPVADIKHQRTNAVLTLGAKF